MIRQEMNIADVAQIVDGRIIGDASLSFNLIASDSRTLTVGGGFLFVAISGEHHNGNIFIKDVYQKGVRCFLCDQHADITKFPGAAFCVVDDAMVALQAIAGYRRKQFDGRIIGVTGSNGKTIVKEWIYQMLQNYYNVVRSPRSYNSQLGVPLSLWQLRDTYEIAIIEAGISQCGEMWRLAEIIRPEIGIITNIGSAHGENFISESEKLKEKLLLFESSELLIFRSDLKVDNREIASFLGGFQARLVSWSSEKDATYRVHINREELSTRLRIQCADNQSIITVPFTDDASIENIIHVIVCMLELGVDMELIQANIQAIEPVEMRLETLNGVYNSTLVNDVYNSDLAGLEVALDVLKQQQHHEEFTVILSDVFQSGLAPKELYAEVAKMIELKQINHFVGVGKAIKKHKDLFPDGSKFFKDTATFLQRYNQSAISNRAVLVKGARKFSFEKITQFLQAQYHKTVLEININSLVDNLNYYRSLIDSGTKVMVMVKALAYGSGGHEIAHVLEHEKVDYLAVAFADEGIALRRSGVRLPIMVMNCDVKDFGQMIEQQLEPEIYSLAVLKDFVRACKYMGVSRSPVHLKIDSGMHRLGFEEVEREGLLDSLRLGEVQVKSVFTHLAGAYEPSLDAFSVHQIELYKGWVRDIESVVGVGFMKHVLNTAGIERLGEYQMDMVRLGIGLYGMGSSSQLKPVSTFRTEISQLREVKKGDTVGYGREGKVEKDALIATIPVGYADGIDRRLGNGNYSFWVGGSFAPTIGNICMDMCMIDVSGITVDVGDRVELIGLNNGAEKMAEFLETISYEILTGIPERVKRVYVRE